MSSYDSRSLNPDSIWIRMVFDEKLRGRSWPWWLATGPRNRFQFRSVFASSVWAIVRVSVCVCVCGHACEFCMSCKNLFDV